ncbi:MAG TPA: cytochrome b/b6 domain-containing protein [Dongiaceae bacterium]|nr:cytochrome b/b6 domain-containing protein [Dongiaceae bacterium]
MTGPKEILLARTWDLPVRLFHWSLVTCVLVSWISAEQGYMHIHYISGLCILALLTFRFLWGLVGSPMARFSHFVRGPRAIGAYLRGLSVRAPSYSVGHNAVAGLAVMALLVLLAIQVGSGLFSSSDETFDGPFVRFVASSAGRAVTAFHEINFNILLALIGVHLASQLFYYFWKRENIIRGMVTGYTALPAEVVRGAGIGTFRHAPAARALICLLPGAAISLAIYALF